MKTRAIALSFAATLVLGFFTSASHSSAQDGDDLDIIDLVHRKTASRYANDTHITRVDATPEDQIIALLVRAGRIDPKSIPFRRVVGFFELGLGYFAIVDAPDLIHVLLGDKAYVDLAVYVAHIPLGAAEQADASSTTWVRWEVESIETEPDGNDLTQLRSLTIKPGDTSASVPFNLPVNLALLDRRGNTLERGRWRFILNRQLEMNRPYFQKSGEAELNLSAIQTIWRAINGFFEQNQKRYERRPFKCEILLDPRIRPDRD